jgi:hypothetical protein
MKNTVFDELTLFWLLAVQASGGSGFWRCYGPDKPIARSIELGSQ